MSNHEESELTHKGPCDQCGSSDARAHYTDGHSFCYACPEDTAWQGDKSGGDGYKQRQQIPSDLMSFAKNDGRFIHLEKRGISLETVKKFGYWIGRRASGVVQVADYRDESGQLVAQKTRDKDKNFSAVGKLKSDMLWGKHLWGSKGKRIIITEGEIDCMSVSQMQGNKWPVVSLPSGAAAAKKTCAANYEWLDGFEEIVLCFDMDEPGRKAVQEAAEVLPPGKVRVTQLPMKDANECLLGGQTEAVIQAIWNAAPYRPDGIVSARDRIQKAMEVADVENTLFPIGAVLNEKVRGARPGEIIMLTSGSGMGKSSFAREVAYGLGHLGGKKIGMAFLEESVEETMLDIAGLHLNKRIRQFPETTNPEEKEAALNIVFDNDTFYLYDHFGSAAEDSLLNKLRYMRTVLECDVVILDHLSIVVSGQDDGDDERKMIDRLMTKLKTMAKATGLILIVVTHLKRKDGKGGKSHEEGGKITLAELRGSGAIAQLSDTVIAFERNQQGDTPNIVTIRILKCRFTGDTGIAGYLSFSKETGRLTDWLGEDPAEDPSDSDFDDDDDIPF